MTLCHVSTNSSMNQLEREKAPHPQLPDASDLSVMDGGTPSKQPACIICIPFHDSQYCHHHSMSDLASSFRRTKWSRCLGTVERSISLRKNDLPALTTLQACERSPIKERSSLFLQLWRVRHEPTASFRRISLSDGRRCSRAMESSSIPRKDRVVAVHPSL